MRLISTKSFTTFAAIAAALTLGACGNKHAEIKEAETEGIYVNVGELKYQVQISRQLNPLAIPEDKTFVQDVDPAQAELPKGKVWFAVFLRIENESDEPQAPAPSYTITDTEHQTYTPVSVGSDNPFFFDPAPIRPHGVAPRPDAVAAQLGSIGGMQLLFQLEHAALDNRPLDLTIKSHVPEDEATITLDV
jgi:hypothetical protein